MDAAWELGITTFDTADAYGGGRSETWIGEWLATKGSEVRDAITIETKTFNPMAEGEDRGLSRQRIRRQIESSLERLGHRAHSAVHGARARSGHAGRGDARGVRRARPGGQGGRGRRVQLHGRAARGGGRDLRARRADALRVGAELVLAPRAGRCRDRVSRLPRARPRVRGAQPHRRRLARGPLSARPGVPGRLADDAAPRWLPPVRERRRLRRARGLRARSARTRRVDGGTRARLAARTCRRSRASSSDRPARSSSSRFAKRSRSSSRQRSTRIWEACSRDRPERARGS